MSSSSPPVLSIVLPVYNEVSTIGLVLEQLKLKQMPNIPFEVIIVESNSTDDSQSILEKYHDVPHFKFIYQLKAKGKGNAVREGLKSATGTILLIQDADLEYDLNDYEKLIQPILDGTTQFVLGSRHSNGWAMRTFKDQKIKSFIFNTAHWSFTLLLNSSLGIWMNDPFTMYKVFNRACIENLPLECDKFDFDWELLIKLVRRGYPPLEIPITYNARSFAEGKKIQMWRDPITWLRAFFRYSFGPVA